jgi:hypothetical protein
VDHRAALGELVERRELLGRDSREDGIGAQRTMGLIRSVSWPTALAMTNESAKLEPYPSSV